jgi:hypothetical protein
MSTETGVRDYNGKPLAEGDLVTAWLDGARYTARVEEIGPHHPGCGDHRHIVLVREDDHAVVESYSDAVVVSVTRAQQVAMANANVSRKREREALEQGDLEGARIQAQIAEDYEEDADFWALTTREKQ